MTAASSESAGLPAIDPELVEAKAELLARIDGVRRQVGYHNPFLLDRPDLIWLVLEGAVDLYAVPVRDGEVIGVGIHVGRVPAGELVFSPGLVPSAGALVAAEEGADLALRAVAVMGTELFEAKRADVAEGDFDLIVVDWLDRWIGHMAGLAVPGAGARAAELLEAEPGQGVPAGRVLGPQPEDVIWVQCNSGRVRLMGLPELEYGRNDPPIPVARHLWVETAEDAILSPAYTPTVLFRDMAWEALDAFHHMVLTATARRLAEAAEQDGGRLETRRDASRRRFETSLGRIGRLLDRHGQREAAGLAEGAGPLIAAVDRVARETGIDPASRGAKPRGRRVLDIAQSLRLRCRRVTLTGDWWRRPGAPLVAFIGETGAGERGRPVALLPAADGRWRLVDPETDGPAGPGRPVTRAEVDSLSGEGWMLYRPFPAKPMSVGEVWRFGLYGLKGDVRTIMTCGLLAALTGLLTPIASGALFSNVIPRADLQTHLWVVLALLAGAVGILTFAVVRGIALLRLQATMDSSVQSAVWDRLLALPAPFFRRFTGGDLADRANSVSAIRELLTGSALQVGLDALFSLVSLALLFWYSAKLALVALGVLLVQVLVTGILLRIQLPDQRALLSLGGRIEGLVFQLLTGLSKLRVSAAEPRAFARWAEEFSVRKRLTYRVRLNAAAQAALAQLFPVLGTLAVYLSVATLLTGPDGRPEFGIGPFMAFTAAFGQLTMAMTSLVATAGTVLAIVPLYERVTPILTEMPEITPDRAHPGEITGRIEFSHVTFAYAPDAPPVLEDLSLTIESGGYIAFVGESGSGKSTLLRLLLGFELPQSGGVYFDGMDQAGLDLTALRRQIGVVLQNGRLMSGSIFDNIVGSWPLTQDDAWAAARLAGLDEDIRALPMGMHTVLSEGGGTLSGGQRQRLMIARALVHRPRILVLDEATSALDNRTQAIVNDSISKLNMTRIVVAHRLSTIQDAHQIYVMKSGRLVEQGDYRSLMALDGEFAALARRQLL
ncbi:NHLP bacteriocin export ABC transporter permease/ATPase subunit [Tistrella mobilis]|uniref:NHLP bacteriocin export ABC transporter permease/ATPase subunit n=1 Tax=Tistrella mobilis TaxID=171437 RepID=UPI0035589125